MTVEFREKTRGRGNTVMTACPFCREELREQIGFAEHAPYCPEVDVDVWK